MPLPKIQHPIFEVYLKSLDKNVRYRPFLVKEEKLLLMALESNDNEEIIETTKQVINNCLIDQNLSVDALPFFDVDYLFIALRAKSVGESIEVKFTCNNITENGACNNVFPAKIDISNCKVIRDESIKKEIDLGSNMMIKMKYPNYTTMKTILDNDAIINKKINIISNSIESIIEGENVHSLKDLTKDDITEFIENLTKEQFKKLEVFVDNFPGFVITANAKCNKCGFDHELEYSDFTSFFV